MRQNVEHQGFTKFKLTVLRNWGGYNLRLMTFTSYASAQRKLYERTKRPYYLKIFIKG